MDFVNQNSVNPLQSGSADSYDENSFKRCLLSSVWSQCRLVASLLDQVGVTYHRVFDQQAHELFLLLINTELTVCYHLDNFNPSSLSALNRDLLAIQSKLISSMDLFVVATLEHQRQQSKSVSPFAKLLGKHKIWEASAKARFEQVICSILEKKLVKK